MEPFTGRCFGNPSSGHVFATPCREAVSTARTAVGALVGAADPEAEVVFLGCGSEVRAV